MPKSKRAKLVSLTKTKKDVADLKGNLINNIRECVDMFKNVFVFTFENMRTVAFKEVRAEWTDSRFFLGKNKVMRVALGRDEEDEYRDGLSQLGQALSGSVGLLFTNRSKEEVGEYFDTFSVRDYARMGAQAAETVTMQAGPLEGMTHTMLEQLRKLGMPVELQKGVLHLTAPFVVCKEGEVLTVDQARILKLFNVQMARFKITPSVMWSEGVCTSLTGQEEKK